MSAFNIGDTVSFTPEHGTIVVGMVTRLNQKTVTVYTKDGHRWRRRVDRRNLTSSPPQIRT